MLKKISKAFWVTNLYSWLYTLFCVDFGYYLELFELFFKVRKFFSGNMELYPSPNAVRFAAVLIGQTLSILFLDDYDEYILIAIS